MSRTHLIMYFVLATWRDRVMGESLVTFSISSAAQVEAIELEGVPVFARVPEKVTEKD